MDIFNEHSVYLDLIPFKHHSIGICFGEIFDNPKFDPRPLSSSQNNNPGTVYKGYVARAFYNFYFFNRDYEKLKFAFYMSPQIMYKDLYYNNKSFHDANPDKGSIYYIRNEKANIIGGNMDVGCLIALRIFKSQVYFFCNPYIGLGYDQRHRDIETLSINDQNYHGDKPVLGKETKETKYLTFVCGAKVGLMLSF